MSSDSDDACKTAADLMQSGLVVFSPIAHSHPIALAGELPTDWEFWQRYDRRMIEACDMLLVLHLPGWETSKGVAAEIAIAKRLGKPVCSILPDNVDAPPPDDDSVGEDTAGTQ